MGGWASGCRKQMARAQTMMTHHQCRETPLFKYFVHSVLSVRCKSQPPPPPFLILRALRAYLFVVGAPFVFGSGFVDLHFHRSLEEVVVNEATAFTAAPASGEVFCQRETFGDAVPGGFLRPTPQGTRSECTYNGNDCHLTVTD